MKNLFEIGQQCTLKIVAITDDTVFLDLNAKTEGIIDASEFKNENGVLTVKEGEGVSVYFVGEKNGSPSFTTKIAGQNANENLLKTAFESGIPVEGSVEKEIKGGYEIMLGNKRAFCPYSQMGFRQKEDSNFFVGRHLSFKILEYKNDGKDILVSNRAILENEHKHLIENLQKKLEVGSEVDAEVVSIQKYGAFVNIFGLEALLPASEISYARVNDISKVLDVGQKIRVKIISADWKNEKISVSKKALEDDPMLSAYKRYAVGQKCNGKIAKIAPYGIFVELEPGVNGLLHISELSGIRENTNLSKMFKVGQDFPVTIKGIEERTNKISLASSTSSEQDETAARYMQSQNTSDTYNPFASLLS